MYHIKRGRRCYRPDYLRAVFWELLIGVVLGGLLISITAGVRDFEKDLARFSEGLFMAVSGNPQEPDRQSTIVGTYIREQFLLGKTLERIVYEEQILSSLSESSRMQVHVLNPEKSLYALLIMADSNKGWWITFKKKRENLKMLKKILESQDQSIPSFDYTYATLIPLWWFWWLVIAQFFAMIGFLVSEDRESPFWQEPYVHVAMVPLLPASVIPFLIACAARLYSLGKKADGASVFDPRESLGRAKAVLERLRQRGGS